jgi:hypothetical protein
MEGDQEATFGCRTIEGGGEVAMLGGEKLHPSRTPLLAAASWLVAGVQTPAQPRPLEQAKQPGDLDGVPRTVLRVHARAGEEASRAGTHIGEDGPAASI